MTCLVCLGPLESGEYHPRFARGLFGRARAPVADFDLARLHEVAVRMVGHVALSGVQRKVSVSPRGTDGSSRWRRRAHATS